LWLLGGFHKEGWKLSPFSILEVEFGDCRDDASRRMTNEGGLLVEGGLEERLANSWLWPGWESSPVFWNKTKGLYGSLLADGLDIVGRENLKEPQKGFGVRIVGLAEFGGCCLDLFGIG
jgi:hypothetical protein